MDYEKLHKETLEGLRRLVFEGNITEEMAKKICPDFVMESEDERTRKALIKIVNGIYQDEVDYAFVEDGISYEQLFSWLEKHKEFHYSPLCNTIKDKIREYIANHFIADTVVKTDMKSIVNAMEEGVRLGKEEQKSVECVWIHKKYNREYRIVSNNARLKNSNGEWIDCVIYAPLYENEFEMFAREKDSFYKEFEKK